MLSDEERNKLLRELGVENNTARRYKKVVRRLVDPQRIQRLTRVLVRIANGELVDGKIPDKNKQRRAQRMLTRYLVGKPRKRQPPSAPDVNGAELIDDRGKLVQAMLDGSVAPERVIGALNALLADQVTQGIGHLLDFDDLGLQEPPKPWRPDLNVERN